MLGVILSQLLGLSRMGFAMGRRADLPRSFAAIHPRYGVPHRAVVLAGSLAAVVAATGTLGSIAATAAFTILVYYAITNWAALRMPERSRLYPDWVPAFGLAVCILLACSLPARIIISGLVVLFAGICIRLAMRGSLSAPSPEHGG
jgi:APA family basic amino acid/polyamine antiporter